MTFTSHPLTEELYRLGSKIWGLKGQNARNWLKRRPQNSNRKLERKNCKPGLNYSVLTTLAFESFPNQGKYIVGVHLSLAGSVLGVTPWPSVQSEGDDPGCSRLQTAALQLPPLLHCSWSDHLTAAPAVTDPRPGPPREHSPFT